MERAQGCPVSNALVDSTNMIQSVIGLLPWADPRIRSFTSCSQPGLSQFALTDSMKMGKPALLTSAWFSQYHVWTQLSCKPPATFKTSLSSFTFLNKKYEYAPSLKLKSRSGVNFLGMITGSRPCSHV